MKKLIRFGRLASKFAKERKKKHKALIQAKQNFENHFSTGMCTSLDYALMEVGFIVDDITEVIPEFNPIFLKAPYPEKSFWWPTNDRESRLKAFDILIKLYE